MDVICHNNYGCKCLNVQVKALVFGDNDQLYHIDKRSRKQSTVKALLAEIWKRIENEPNKPARLIVYAAQSFFVSNHPESEQTDNLDTQTLY